MLLILLALFNPIATMALRPPHRPVLHSDAHTLRHRPPALLCASPSINAKEEALTTRALPAVDEKRTGLSSWAASNAWLVISLGLLLLLDICFYTFPLPFLGEHLMQLGHTSADIAQLVASFTYTGLVAAVVVLVRSFKSPRRTLSHRYATLAGVTLAVAAGAFAQALSPSYPVILIGRLVQGAGAQLAWSNAQVAAASLGPVAGIKASAMVMGGASLGEVVGPQFGARCFSLGGVRWPFGIAAALAAMLSTALACSAAALRGNREAPRGGAMGSPTDGDVVAHGGAKGTSSPLRDGPVRWLVGQQALSNAAVRSLLDAVLPLHLRLVHGYGVGAISDAMFGAAAAYIAFA